MKNKPYQVIVEWARVNESCAQRWETFTGSTARKEAAAKLREVAKDPNNVNLRMVEYWNNSQATEAK